MATALCVGTAEHLRTAVRTLEGADVSAVAVEDAATAERRLQSGPAHCVVAAHDLPDASGLELVRELNVPTILCPADGSERLAGRALAAGAAGYVPAAAIEGLLVEQVAAALEPADCPDARRTVVECCRTHTDGGVESADAAAPLADQPTTEGTPEHSPAGRYGRSSPCDSSDEPTVEPTSTVRRRDSPDRLANDVAGRETAGEPGPTADGWTAGDDADGPEWAAAIGDVEGDREARTLQALHWATGDFFDHECSLALSDSLATAARHVLDVDLAAVYRPSIETGLHEPVAARGVSLEDLPSVEYADGAPDGTAESGRPANALRHEPAVPQHEFPTQTVEWYAIGEHGLLCLGRHAPDCLDEWSATLASLLASTGDAALERADRELQLERANTLLDAATDGVVEFAPDGTVAAVDEAFADLTAIDPGQLVGDRLAGFAVDGAEELRAAVRRVQSDDGPQQCSVSVALDSAAATTVAIDLTLVRAAVGGERSRTFGVVRDATARRQIADRLERAGRRRREAHDAALTLQSVGDPDHAIDEALAAVRTATGADAAWILERDGDEVRAVATDGSSDDDATPQGVAPVARHSVADGRTRTVDAVDDLEPEGATAEARFSAAITVPIDDDTAIAVARRQSEPFGDAERQLAELLVAHLRATLDRLSRASALRTERDRIAALFENVPIPVVRTRIEDGQAVVEAVNPSFERVFGYENAEIVDERLDEHIVPPDRMDRARDLTRCGRDGELVDTEVRRLTANGTRDFRLTVVPVSRSADETVNYAIYTDVTERKQRQQRLEVLNRVLRHDLRNGMNVVKGSAELLEEHVEGGAQLHVEAIERRASEMIDLAEKTRTVQRSLQTDPTDAGPVDVVDAVQEAIEELDVAGPETDIRTEMPAHARARVGKLLPTAVRHVLENAVVHHDDDPTIEVTVRERDDDRTVEIVVADDGPGIPESERTLVTEQQEITQLRHGSGLGLWIVNWIVTGCGGSLDIQTAEPHGTVVRMELPQAAVDRNDLQV